MEEFRKQGKTILFVSHSLFTVKAFCTKALWINEGVVMDYGDLGPVVLAYEDFLRRERAKQKGAARRPQRLELLPLGEEGHPRGQGLPDVQRRRRQRPTPSTSAKTSSSSSTTS